MEIEQSQSIFRKPSLLLDDSCSYPSAGGRAAFLYKFPETDGSSFWSKASSLAYRWLDSLTGTKSYKVRNPYLELQQPYAEVVDFLRSHGIISYAALQDQRFNDAPAFFRFMVFGAYPAGMTDGKPLTNVFGSSYGKNQHEVFSKAIGEFLERYFLTIYRKSDLIRAPLAALRKRNMPFLDPAHLAGFSEGQKSENQRRQWNEDSVFCWIEAERVLTGEKVLVPAQLAYWNYAFEGEPLEPFLREENTNGGGGMFTREEAVLSGLYELVQRDAFLVYWLNSLTPEKVVPESVPDDLFQEILAKSKRYGFEVHCMNTTADTEVPSFVVALLDKSGKSPYWSLGGGCEANPAHALRRALEEAWIVYCCIRPLEKYDLPSGYQPFRDRSLGQEERMRFWANSTSATHGDFFLRGKKRDFSDYSFGYPLSFVDKKKELRFLAGKVEELGHGYEVYAYLPEHDILNRLGYCSAKVIVPQIIPLYLWEHNAPLGARRIKEVPFKLGLAAASEPNPWPHPFP